MSQLAQEMQHAICLVCILQVVPRAALRSLPCKQRCTHDCTPIGAFESIADASTLRAVKEWCFELFLKRKMSRSFIIFYPTEAFL